MHSSRQHYQSPIAAPADIGGPRWLRGGWWGSFGHFRKTDAFEAERFILRPEPRRALITRVLKLLPSAFENLTSFVDPSQVGMAYRKAYLSMIETGTQPEHLLKCLYRSIEVSREKLDCALPDRPKPRQRIVRTGAHCLL